MTQQPERKPSKVETIKTESRGLRGTIADTLRSDATHFGESDVQLLKFHGSYQQDDRDVRNDRRKQGQEPAYLFMVRVAIPGGALTAGQYLALDALADQHGNHTLRITTRQGIQFHGVLKTHLQETIAGVNRALLTTLAACGDVNRNVMASPLPYRNQRYAQVSEYAERLARHLRPRTSAYHEIWINGEKLDTARRAEEDAGNAEPIYGRTYLPRKFKIGIALPEDNSVDVYSQDIGLVAVLRDDMLQGFNVLVGGGHGMTHGKSETFPRMADLMAFVTPDRLIPVVEAIVTTQRDFGDRSDRKHARMKYLVQEWGIEKFRAEVERRVGYALDGPKAMPPLQVPDYLGWHEQGDGKWFFGLFVENGRIKDAGRQRMRTGLRVLLQRFPREVRLTPSQDVLLTHIDAEEKALVEAVLQEHGIPLPEKVSMARRYSMACPALPTCGLALTESERVMPFIIDEFEETLSALGLSNEPISIRMTGCPNGCARPYLSEVGLVGRTPGTYNIYLGGDVGGNHLNQLFLERVAQESLVKTLAPVFARFRDVRQPGESFGAFCRRQGMETLRALASQ